MEAGPAAWGWQEQCWTLAGLDLLLHRLGWSVQVGTGLDLTPLRSPHH